MIQIDDKELEQEIKGMREIIAAFRAAGIRIDSNVKFVVQSEKLVEV